MDLQRRRFAAFALAVPVLARAHHGWSGFDQNRPLYVAGKAVKVAWRNPHVEFDLELAPTLALPADLAQRKLPAQTAPVDGPALLAKAQLPTRRDRIWHVELAPLTRMTAWKLEEFKPGTELAMLAYASEGEKGEPVLRVEYLWVGGGVYALRSSPA